MDVKPLRRYPYIVIFILGLLMPYATGFLGLMPLDQSIIFEAGGRIANGEMPFRDFTLPYGLVPSLMQAIFFKALGVTWFAYVTHAAIINGCFALLIFDCLVLLFPGIRLSKWLPGALLAAWSFYPMTGTPFLENHSLFFALLSYWCLLAGVKRKKGYLIFLCPALLVPAFYSKPIPAIFWLLMIAYESWLNRILLLEYLHAVIGGCIFAGFLLVLPAWLYPAESFYYYTIQLPFRLGKGRVQGSFMSRLIHTSVYFKLLLISLIPFVLYLLQPLREGKKHFPLVFRCLLLISISVLFGVLTKNAFYNVTTPVFIFTFSIFSILLCASLMSNRLQSLYRLLNIVLWLTLFIGITRLNFRRTIDIHFEWKDMHQYSATLGIFVKTPLNKYSKEDVEKLKGLISKRQVLYTGDMQFLFSLSGQKNPLPLTHINDQTTYNSSDPIHYDVLKKQIINNMLDGKVQWLVEDESIYNPRQDLVAWLGQLKGKQIDSFAGIKVFSIDSIVLRQVASSLKTRRER